MNFDLYDKNHCKLSTVNLQLIIHTPSPSREGSFEKYTKNGWLLIAVCWQLLAFRHECTDYLIQTLREQSGSTRRNLSIIQFLNLSIFLKQKSPTEVRLIQLYGFANFLFKHHFMRFEHLVVGVINFYQIQAATGPSFGNLSFGALKRSVIHFLA